MWGSKYVYRHQSLNISTAVCISSKPVHTPVLISVIAPLATECARFKTEVVSGSFFSFTPRFQSPIHLSNLILLSTLTPNPHTTVLVTSLFLSGLWQYFLPGHPCVSSLFPAELPVNFQKKKKNKTVLLPSQ